MQHQKRFITQGHCQLDGRNVRQRNDSKKTKDLKLLFMGQSKLEQ